VKIRQLDLVDAEYIAHRYAVERLNFEDEPMPPFHTRDAGKLESCLEEPFKSFDGKMLHRTFVERAALLFYLVTKNHCFSNGNKRMAVTLTTVFFFINKKWLEIPAIELYNIAKQVAASAPRDKEKVQSGLIEIFKKHTIPLNQA